MEASYIDYVSRPSAHTVPRYDLAFVVMSGRRNDQSIFTSVTPPCFLEEASNRLLGVWQQPELPTCYTRLWEVWTWVMKSARNSGLWEYFSANYFPLKRFFFPGLYWASKCSPGGSTGFRLAAWLKYKAFLFPPNKLVPSWGCCREDALPLPRS